MPWGFSFDIFNLFDKYGTILTKDTAKTPAKKNVGKICSDSESVILFYENGIKTQKSLI